ncbi:MAG: hypothetical protein QE494_07945, partial [Ramlibacter sp.]|uniref:hypothetical protein n=1 Tax=Ramlibacter sp. TaxID=1917967 RepID=UPI00261C0EE9
MTVWRTRQQERLAFACALALAVAVFETWPGLDLWASGQFYVQQAFEGRGWLWVWVLYEWSPTLARALVLLALLAVGVALIRPGLLPRHWVRREIALSLVA